MTCILVVRWKKFAQRLPLPLSKERKIFSGNFIAVSPSPENFAHFQKKGEIYKLNISEVIYYQKYVYLNAQKLLFQSNLWESTSSRVLNTSETTMAALLLEFAIIGRHTELKNISVSEIWNVRTLWQNVECRSHVLLSLDAKKLRNVFQCHYLKKGKHFLEFL